MRFIKTCIVMVALGLSVAGYADEVTGRRFTEIANQMSTKLVKAQEKVDALEEKRASLTAPVSPTLLKDRKAALEELRDLKEELEEAEDGPEREELVDAVSEQTLKVASLSTEFIEMQKNDIMYQSQQLGIIDDTLSSVILKMEELEALSQNVSNPEEAARLEKERKVNMVNTARMINSLAKRGGDSSRWDGLRQTLVMQKKLMERKKGVRGNLVKMLKEQRENYELALSQISIARTALEEDKETLSQIALQGVASSLLEKAARILVDYKSPARFGESILNSINKREINMIEFIDQTNIVEAGTSAGSGAASVYTPGDVPGFDELLTMDIN